jgi:hypothetical protein
MKWNQEVAIQAKIFWARNLQRRVDRSERNYDPAAERILLKLLER